jgi:hypothetical protein
MSADFDTSLAGVDALETSVLAAEAGIERTLTASGAGAFAAPWACHSRIRSCTEAESGCDLGVLAGVSSRGGRTEWRGVRGVSGICPLLQHLFVLEKSPASCITYGSSSIGRVKEVVA